MTTKPLRVNSQNEMGLPDRLAIPSITTLALAPHGGQVATEVGAEGKRPPQHIRVGPVGQARGDLTSLGVIVATYGTLSMMPDTGAPDTPRISIVVDSASPPVISIADWAISPTTPVFTKSADHHEQTGEEEQRLPLDTG